jgi:hypothetical protein
LILSRFMAQKRKGRVNIPFPLFERFKRSL